ncbi:MAG: cytochrome c family protein [Acetobacteraceae bacterium]
MKQLTALAFASIVLLPLAPARAQDATAGEATFKRLCGACHSPLAGKNMVGPSLFGVIGRTAGSVPNFRYSKPNRESGKVWDATSLDPYLTNPRAVIPGTTMVFVGIKDAKQRADVIAYLATLK